MTPNYSILTKISATAAAPHTKQQETIAFNLSQTQTIAAAIKLIQAPKETEKFH